MEQAHIVYHYHTHHQAPDTTIHSSDLFRILIVIFPLPITKALYGAQHLVTTYFGQQPIWPEKKI